MSKRKNKSVFQARAQLALTFRSAWAKVNAVAFTFGLAAILSVGPTLQLYSAALITSEETSIYSTAYETNFVLQPQLREWIFAAFDLLYISMALLIVLLSIRVKSIRTLFVFASAITFAVLTTVDFLSLSILDSATAATFFECFLANLFGSPLIIVVAALAAALAESVSKALATHSWLRWFVVPSVPPLVGLVVITATYYLVTLLYSPTESQFSAVVTAPVSGEFSVEDLRRSRDEDSYPEDPPVFSIFGKQNDVPPALVWMGRASGFKVQWQNDSEMKYDLYVGLFDGCSREKDRKNIRKGLQKVSVNVKQISLMSDDGMADLVVGANEDGYFEMPGERTGMYWVTPSEEKDELLNVTTFLDENAQMKYWNPTGDATLNYSVMLLSSRESRKRELANREVTLYVDGKRRRMLFQPNTRAQWDDLLGCRMVQLKPETNDLTVTTSLNAGVSLVLRPQDDTIAASVARGKNDILQIQGINGWLAAKSVKKTDADNLITAGRLGLITFVGEASQFNVGGLDVGASRRDQVTITDATMMASINEDGELSVQGRSGAIYKNGERVNRTRWERLEWQERAVLFGGVPGLCFWLFSILASMFRRDVQFGELLFDR